MKRHENAVRKATPDKGDDATDADYEVMSLAAECDRIEERLANNARSLAEHLTHFADDVDKGYRSSSPLGSSITRDIDALVEQLRMSQDSLARFIRVVYGKDVLAAFREAVKS